MAVRHRHPRLAPLVSSIPISSVRLEAGARSSPGLPASDLSVTFCGCDLASLRRPVTAQDRDRLHGQLDAARRAGFRQAAPFSRGTPRRAPRRLGRKAGAAYGRRGCRATPKRVDERHDALLPSACLDCGGTVAETRVASQTQIDLPPVRPVVWTFAVHVGRCQQCHRRVQGRHPLQASDALGAAAVQLGPAVVTLSALLHVQLGVSFGRIATLFRTRTHSHQSLAATFHPVSCGLVRRDDTSETPVLDSSFLCSSRVSAWAWRHSSLTRERPPTVVEHPVQRGESPMAVGLQSARGLRRPRRRGRCLRWPGHDFARRASAPPKVLPLSSDACVTHMS